MSYLHRHRVGAPLGKAIDLGKRFFILYGDGVKDCYLEDFYEGVVSLRESIQNFFLAREDCGHFVVVNSTEMVQVFRKKGDEIVDISESYLTLGYKEDDMGDDEDDEPERKQSKESQQLEQNLSESNVKILNYLGIVRSRAQDKNVTTRKTAIYFEDFEWLGKLYSSNNNDSLELIKALKDFYKIDECYTVVSLEDAELLKKYNFETKGSNVLFLGNPSAEEIKYAYLLKFFSKTDFSQREIQVDIFDELEDISQAISSGKKSLREALQVLDAVVIDKKAKELRSIDFEIAIEKITEEKVTLDDVIINDEEKAKVINAIEAFKNSTDTRDYRKGFILTGPPGTGKTQLVKALANDYNFYFMAPKLSDLKGEYVGQTSGKVKRIFDEARANAPTIMFIDEADTVFPSRDLGSGASDSYNLDMVNQFLQEIEGLTSGKEKIFVIAATNRANIIDAAIQSRLTERIPIGLPDAKKRIDIFNKKLERYNFTLNEKRYLNEIQSKTVNMSGRDIENYVKRLKEYVKQTPFGEIENLGDDEESHKVLLKVLELNEGTLIDDLTKTVPVQVLEPHEIDMEIKDIIGYEYIKNRISRQSEYIKSSEAEKRKASKFKIKISKGVLLYGPPGNGKTMLAQAIAKDNNFYFVKVLSKDFTSDSISKQLDNLQVIFDQVLRLSKMCSKYQGVVLFFDEFDALAGVTMSSVVRGTLLDYLASGENSESIGLRSEQSKVLLIAATNFDYLLDQAVVRKGRIDTHLLMDNPSKSEGIEMLQKKFNDDASIALANDVNVEVIYEKLQEEVERQSLEKKAKREDGKKKNDKKSDEEEIRPSGSAIFNLFDELKAEAYFSDRNKDANELILTKEMVDRYFHNSN